MSQSGDISFTNDVAKSVAKELGVSEDFVKHHIDFIVHRLKKLVAIPSIVTVQLPHIGLFYSKLFKMKKTYEFFEEKYEMDKATPTWKALHQKHKEKLESELVSEFLEEKTYSKHKTGAKINRKFFTKGMDFKQLEEWQNKD